MSQNLEFIKHYNNRLNKVPHSLEMHEFLFSIEDLENLNEFLSSILPQKLITLHAFEVNHENNNTFLKYDSDYDPSYTLYRKFAIIFNNYNETIESFLYDSCIDFTYVSTLIGDYIVIKSKFSNNTMSYIIKNFVYKKLSLPFSSNKPSNAYLIKQFDYELINLFSLLENPEIHTIFPNASIYNNPFSRFNQKLIKDHFQQNEILFIPLTLPEDLYHPILKGSQISIDCYNKFVIPSDVEISKEDLDLEIEKNIYVRNIFNSNLFLIQFLYSLHHNLEFYFYKYHTPLQTPEDHNEDYDEDDEDSWDEELEEDTVFIVEQSAIPDENVEEFF